MAQALTAPLAQDVDLDQSCSIIFEAVDPTTGNAVTGVTISGALIRVETALGVNPDDLSSGPFQFVPGPDA